MADEKQQSQVDTRMQAENLYREETFTDRAVGTITRLSPIFLDGKDDENRSIVYVGQAQLMTAAGPLPLHFELEADSLHQAVDRFSEAANQAAEEMVERLKKMQRDSTSSIVMPGDGGGGAGGMPGGGKFPMS